MRVLIIAVALGLALVNPGYALLAQTRRTGPGTSAREVIDHQGQYTSPDGLCHAGLEIASMGGFLILTTGPGTSRELRVDDVTGMASVRGHTLVHSTSPIYGIPGIFVYGYDSKKARRIVASRNVTKAYPDGNDFFELKGVSVGKPVTIYFYFAPDVEKVDFAKFRTPAFLFRVHLDGTGFHRAAGR